ncbi:MAG: flagellar basal body rod protein FlgB [Chloroflexi bacterium]|nr:flagellar basal body rod protein FlgB [Chloroflexota bacterium]
MIDALFSQPNYLGAKKLLDVAVLRHEAIASNLANVETPNYQRVDVAPGFEVSLRQALAARDPARLASVQPQLAVDGQAIAQRQDGNTVQLESELMRLHQNTVAHTLHSQLITSALLRLRLAITGRPS